MAGFLVEVWHHIFKLARGKCVGIRRCTKDYIHKLICLFQLYNEVKAHRTGCSLRPITDGQNALRISSCSVSTLSSEVTDPSDSQSNEYSEALTQQSNASIDSHTSQLSHITSESSDQCSDQSKLLNQQSTGEQKAIDTAELEEILETCLKLKMENKSCFVGQDDLLNPFKRFQSMEITCGSDKKKNNTALNAVRLLFITL